jgi:hypothetical protein
VAKSFGRKLDSLYLTAPAKNRKTEARTGCDTGSDVDAGIADVRINNGNRQQPHIATDASNVTVR